MAIRYKSEARFLEMPVVSIAVGPDPANHESRGHARGVIAMGDIATGVFAMGGVARGVVALGGVAFGGIALGGLGLGLLAFGGLALGYFAAAGARAAESDTWPPEVSPSATPRTGRSIGKYVGSARLHRDPEAVRILSAPAARNHGKLLMEAAR